jgi:hypothetical protein
MRTRNVRREDGAVLEAIPHEQRLRRCSPFDLHAFIVGARSASAVLRIGNNHHACGCKLPNESRDRKKVDRFVAFRHGRAIVEPGSADGTSSSIGTLRTERMIEMLSKIRPSIPLVAALISAFGIPCAQAAPSPLDLTCSGNSYGKEGNPFPTTETVSFVTDGRGLVTLALPNADRPAKARVVSSNAIQLRFAAGDLIGEYFNFTGDLFLIHKDGKFTRLVCKPKS